MEKGAAHPTRLEFLRNLTFLYNNGKGDCVPKLA